MPEPIGPLISLRCLRRPNTAARSHALYAFDVELARVREVAREPMPGEIRLQWWDEVIAGERDGEAAPIRSPRRCSIRSSAIGCRATGSRRLIEAHRFDLYDDPMAQRRRSRSLRATTVVGADRPCGGIFSGRRPEPTRRSRPGLPTASPALSARVPAARRAASALCAGRFAGASRCARRRIFSPARRRAGLNAALAELRAHRAPASRCGAATRSRNCRRRLLPAFLPVALVRPSLDRLGAVRSVCAGGDLALAAAMADLARGAQSCADRGISFSI